jgi:uncharacterized protein (DUF2126 family)/transglutaminase-like putative cysteine protease
VRVLIQHVSRYRYPRPALLGPHLLRLKPAAHARARVETYSLQVTSADVRWQQDGAGNFVARATWPNRRVTELEVAVEMAVDIRPVNPFDFTLDQSGEAIPIDYASARRELAPYLVVDDPSLKLGPKATEFLAGLPRSGASVALLVELNRRVKDAVRYIIREEPGVWTPEQTLAEGRGSCRDSAVLLMAALRSRGLAARFVSGYLVQLTDEGMIPDEPKGVSRDVVDLHAWAEVFLPGAGWIGLDATSGLFCGEGHIPLACTAQPQLAAAVEGTTDELAKEVGFTMRVGRLGHEVRPTAPFADDVWGQLKAAGEATDAKLQALGITLTTGGEPTFNSRLHDQRPEWNGEALGPTKWQQGCQLAKELQHRLCPGGVVLLRQGKYYPGESLPRWTLELIGHRDGRILWQSRKEPWLDPPGTPTAKDVRLAGQAKRLAEALAARLGVAGHVLPAYEDPWRFLQEEAALPVDLDPLSADLNDPEERRRLTRVLGRGLDAEAGFVVPIERADDRWRSEHWTFRRGQLFLLPGDSPAGLRLPLKALGGPPVVEVKEAPIEPPDPRGPAAVTRAREVKAQRIHKLVADGKLSGDIAEQLLPKPLPAGRAPSFEVRTALCVEPRGGVLYVFLPPVPSAADFLALVEAVDAVRKDVDAPVMLEGYPPPADPSLKRLSVAPDPGVLEVNVPPTIGFAEYAELADTVFDAALHAGLHSEKYLLDGRMAGSGGGHHLTLGGPTVQTSPWLTDPRLLASLITFAQHHPSLAYLFSGLFVGPTSQAPRLDEARHEALYEMEIALEHAHAQDPSKGPVPPWLTDALFRHLLADLTGNTHRAELSIDKLFDWRTPQGRQGLLELRAFEMPPHPRMMVAQAQLARGLVAALAQAPYQAPLVRWGQQLHDRFLLPTWLWRDFEDVLGFLEARGLKHPAEAYRAFLEMRCPVAGQLVAGDVRLEVRNALEPWNVLAEEPYAGGTSRYVDSSVERIEVRVEGLVPGRHEVLVNGYRLPLKATGRAGEAAAGVRFRAWAPAHSLHPHLGIHHPVRLDVLDRWANRSLGACAYHVWHPEGRAFDTPPLTRFEASARRAQRFTVEGAASWPLLPKATRVVDDTPFTLDLRRLPIDHPMDPEGSSA